MPIQLLLQVILIFLNAFFAATEIAVISLNKTKLKKMSEEGDKTAKRLYKLTETPAGFLSTIQIGITLAGFLGSAFAADNFAGPLTSLIYNDWGLQALSYNALNTVCVIIITIILSYFTLVFGELVPKRIAMQKPYLVARFTSRVVYGLSIVMKPVIWWLSFSTNMVLKLFRLKTEAEAESVTEDEIKMMVDLGEETGTVEKNEQKWIKNVFEFNDTIVREIMTPSRDVKYLNLEATREEIEALVRETNYSRFPVCKTDLNDIIGILNIKDLFIYKDKKLVDLIRPAYYIPETTLADDLFHNMQSTKNPFAVVVDEYGTTTGIVTNEDLIEEIVGNVYDEYDTDIKPEIIEVEPNKYLASGNLLISDLNEYFNLEIPESDAYDTLGGFIFSKLDHVPRDGSKISINYENINFEVMKMLNRRIKEVTISFLEKPEVSEEE